MTDYTWVFVLSGTSMVAAGLFSLITIYRLVRYGPEYYGDDEEPTRAA